MNKVRKSFRGLLNKLSPAQLEEVATKVVRFMDKSSQRCYDQGYKLGLMLGNKF